jgi:hypothetical protein
MIRRGNVAVRFSVLLALLSGASGGCTTDHDALARQPKAGSSGGGAGGSGGFGGFGNTGNEAPQGGRVNPDIEAPGDNVLTIVNGIVDAPSVRLCFARVGADGLTGDFVGDPLAELDYATSTVLTELPGFSFVDDVIEPWAIAGDLSLIAKLDCQAAVERAQTEEAKAAPDPDGEGGAPPTLDLEMPTLRARPVAALPAGTVDIDRSILMVLSGCIGGAAYSGLGLDFDPDDPEAELDDETIQSKACGADYDAEWPTLQPVVVKLSREHQPESVGLQGLHASVATTSLDLRSSNDDGTISLVFASAVDFGSIEPHPADTRFTPEQLGVEARGYGLQAVGETGDVVYQETWSDLFAISGLAPLSAARTYTAVFLGPNPLLRRTGWWNTPAFALVDNDPTRE